MKRHDFDDLAAFLVIAEEQSFSRAAARLGISSSGLSHIMRLLEERLGVRLLARTTRSVSTTDAGERLLATLRPAFEDIHRSLQSLGELREKPSGTIRITVGKHAAVTLIQPMLTDFGITYPDIRLEIIVGDRLEDIVASRFDAGIRFGERIDRDMIGIRIGPDIRPAVVGSPAYFERHPIPTTPRDLAEHNCVNYFMVSNGTPYAWEFDDGDREVEVRVNGGLMVNDFDLMLQAALDGTGLVYAFEDMFADPLGSGRLVRVLEDYCRPFPGYYIYYPSRRQVPPALTAFIEALRTRHARNGAQAA
jgi:DNA-binding transcriptional LysR family regulator